MSGHGRGKTLGDCWLGTCGNWRHYSWLDLSLMASAVTCARMNTFDDTNARFTADELANAQQQELEDLQQLEDLDPEAVEQTDKVRG